MSSGTFILGLVKIILKTVYNKLLKKFLWPYRNLIPIGLHLNKFLIDFCGLFFQLYVLELMLIEADARRFISDAIEIEKELKSMEIREKAKGRIVIESIDYTKKRGELATIMG